ncbi:MAG: DNA primase [Akkermansia sp.]
MPRITAECEARIKDSADIVELLGRYIELRRAGNSWKACCPFHAEKTPSFHVNPARQSFHCFGCGVGGDAAKFLMMFENLSYPDALRRLADMAGIPVMEENESPEFARRRRQRARIIELNKLAADYYHRLLCKSPDAAPAREYLKARAINIEMARAWQLGWAPQSFNELAQLARSKGFDDRQMLDAYLLGRGERGNYPVFRERLMFPIINLRQEVLGFSGRILDSSKDPRKYVNTADTIAFHKGELLFGLNKATRAIGQSNMQVVLCEGQIDVLACHEKAGITNAVAGLGTAFTDEQALLLRKYAKRAILCYDGDNAGQKACEKSYRKLATAGLEVYQAVLPQGEDPDSLIQSQGADALQECIAKARPYLELRVSRDSATGGQDAHQRASQASQMADLVAEITDTTHRDLTLADLATRLHIGLEQMREMVNDILKQKKQTKQQAPRDDFEYSESEWDGDMEEASPMPARPPIKLHPAIRGLIALAAGNTQAQGMLIDRIEELQDAINMLSGGDILARLLERLPQAHDAAAWHQFLSELAPEQARALQHLEAAPMHLDQAEIYVQQSCERAATDCIKVQIDQVRSRLRDPSISELDKLKDLEQITKLQRILNSAGEMG